MIIFLDGPINAGKSTVGALLTARLPHTVHIEVDQLRHFAGCLTLRQAIPHTLTDAASLVTAWVGRGFHVVATWPIDGVNQRRFAAAVAGCGVPLFTFTLLPRLDIALADRGRRPLTPHERSRVKEMYAGMYAGGQAAGVILDNSDQTPDETVQTILDHIESETGRPVAKPAMGQAPVPAITLTGHPSPADVAYIRQRIKEFNDSASDHHRLARPTGKEPLAALMHDAMGVLGGGLLASVYWGWLDIEELWIDEPWRGKGHGRALMQLVEEAAIGRGCRLAQVWTWDFQALGFYERLGFQIVGRQVDYPPGQSFYWLRKELARHDP